jgi:hypothetical protein
VREVRGKGNEGRRAGGGARGNEGRHDDDDDDDDDDNDDNYDVKTLSLSLLPPVVGRETNNQLE